MWNFIAIAILCLVLSEQSAAQPIPTYRAIFSSDGPFFTECDGNTEVPANTHVVIVWDADHNGPGGYDQIPATQMGIPEGMFGNIYDFFTEEGGVFQSPIFEGDYMYDSPEPFYLILEHEDSIVTRWTSATRTLQPIQFQWEPPDFVWIPASQWLCDTVSAEIPCETDPPNISFNLSEGWPQPVCVRTCSEGETWVMIWNSNEDLDGTRFPALAVETGCEGQTPAPAEYDPLSWDFLFSGWWAIDVVGHEVGWITIALLDSIPCGDVSNFEAFRVGSTVQINWATSRETDLSHFELWSFHAQYPNWLRHLGNVQAAGAASQYSLLDSDPQPASYIWYCVVMVGGDSMRWGARRAYVPVPAAGGDAPEIASSPRLIGNFPNPFNSETKIEFELPSESSVALEVYDLSGRLVNTMLNSKMPAGEHAVSFRGDNLASGLYFVRLTAGEFQFSHKMILLK